MKTIKNILPLILLLFAITIIGSSCGPDNTGNNPEPQFQCTYEGFSSDLVAPNDQYPESDLFTDFFNTSSNGPEVEIYHRTTPGDFNFTTTVVTEGGTGTGILTYGGANHTVNVTCHKTGAAIGEKMQFEITGSVNAKFCVLIDSFH